jgi:hypothetical protein
MDFVHARSNAPARTTAAVHGVLGLGLAAGVVVVVAAACHHACRATLPCFTFPLPLPSENRDMYGLSSLLVFFW